MNSIFGNSKILKNIKGFIQAGACIGEEIPDWERNKIQNQIFIEPIPNLFQILQQKSLVQQHKPNAKCYQVALSNEDGMKEFHLSTDSLCSSSLLNFGKDAPLYGNTLKTSAIIQVESIKLDSLIEREKVDMNLFNLLFLDVQGSEFNVIKGAENNINKFDMIFSEVNHVDVYEGITKWEDFNEYVKSLGFNLADLRKLEGSKGSQSEALYFRKGFKLQ